MAIDYMRLANFATEVHDISMFTNDLALGPAPFDLVIRGGAVWGTETVADVGIRAGVVRAISPSLPGATREVDARGALVLPGLVDAHTHVYWGATPLGIDPDSLAAASGVTAWIDTGSAGAGNLAGLVHHVIERSPLAIKAFVHLSFLGLVSVGQTELRFGELFDFRLADVPACLRAIEEHAPHVLGVKVRLGANATGPNGLHALQAARTVGDATGLRVMVHIADPPPLLDDALTYLRKGDVVTHCYTPGLMGILDRSGSLRRSVLLARDAGVLFDVGHGSGSFSFEVASRALAQGFPPDLISSDLHAYNVDGPVFDLPTTMTKFLALGMPLDEILRRVTHDAGALFGDGVGRLAVGSRADVVVARLERGEVVLGDSRGAIVTHPERFAIQTTILSGRVLEPPPITNQGRRKPGLPPLDPRLTRPNRLAEDR
jgi:dihydroorotase